MRVTFTPGGRTNWHTHPATQTLHVLTGVGRLQELGKPAQALLPGDTAIIPPGVKHWRNWLPSTYYCTHALAPLMVITDTVPTSVNALSIAAPEIEDLLAPYRAVIAAHFPADMARQSIFGHSMGGHGALIAALKNPGRCRSVSAFAPITHPMMADWSAPALAAYLGPDATAQRAWDSVALIEDGARVTDVLVDQGTADGFLKDGLKPELLQKACADAGIALTLRMQEGYDHSYFFISTFMADHIAWHAARLKG